jgi:Flp pilus assembly pilin Flp
MTISITEQMAAKMNLRKLLNDEQGNVSTEYVIFVAAIGMLLIVGVSSLFNAMSNLFGAWAGYFGGGS